jgi:hypothetical protein
MRLLIILPTLCNFPRHFTSLLCLQPSDVSRWFTLVGIVASFISTFFAHGFLTLAKQVRWKGL